MLILTTFFEEWILTGKVCETELVFGLRSEFISSAVQDVKCLCSGYGLCHPD